MLRNENTELKNEKQTFKIKLKESNEKFNQIESDL